MLVEAQKKEKQIEKNLTGSNMTGTCFCNLSFLMKCGKKILKIIDYHTLQI
jgi:hypothetical protein